MEKKTIGAFIAALRKASGLTQRELAEKLNVSDKAVSRWEREESLPDLSLIPAIAEIFGVTADELLRGERAKQGESQPRAEEKSEKQIQNMVRRTVLRFSTHSIIAAGIGLAGLIAAMIADLAFYRGYIAFFAALALYVTAALCEMGFLIAAMSALNVEEDGAAVQNGRRRVLNRALGVFGLIIVLFAVTLPVVVLPYNPYMGLTADSWLLYGSVFAAAGLLLSMLLGRISGTIAIKRGLYSLDAGQSARRRLRLACVLAVLCAMALTFVGEVLLTNDVTMYADTLVFDNYDDFTAYMMRDEEVVYQYGNAVPDSEIVYYDDAGNLTSEKKSRMEEIVNAEGETVLRYYRRNDNAAIIRYTASDTCLPITVITQGAMYSARRTVNKIHSGFIAAYILELLAGVTVYIIKSRRMENRKP